MLVAILGLCPEMPAPRRILVTGGAGFIGSHVCEHLLDSGHSLAIVDSLNNFYPPEFKKKNLLDIYTHGHVDFMLSDICEVEAIVDFLKPNPPDAIIHLAASAGVRPSLQQPFLCQRSNVQGTMTVLEICRQMGIPKLVFASSSSIYGISNTVPFKESDPEHLPISVYAATKLAGEKLCYTYAHLYGIQTVCLRLFTVYGPRQRPDLAIRKFTTRINHGTPIPVFGDGTSGRDYTYVEDTVQGILSALDLECGFEIFNLGNSHPVKLLDMIATIERALGKRAKLDFQPDQPGDVPITFADITRAKEKLGYHPTTDFEEGICKFVSWFRQQLG